MDLEVDGLVIRADETRTLHWFVEVEAVGKLCALYGAEAAGVFHGSAGQPGVGGIFQHGIGAVERGELEHFHLIGFGLFAIVFHVIGKRLIHDGQGGAEDGVVEVLGEINASGALRIAHHQRGVVRRLIDEVGKHGQRGAAFHLSIARFHLIQLRLPSDFFRHGFLLAWGLGEGGGLRQLMQLTEAHAGHEKQQGKRGLQGEEFAVGDHFAELRLLIGGFGVVDDAFLQKVVFARFRIRLLFDGSKQSGVQFGMFSLNVPGELLIVESSA